MGADDTNNAERQWQCTRCGRQFGPDVAPWREGLPGSDPPRGVGPPYCDDCWWRAEEGAQQ